MREKRDFLSLFSGGGGRNKKTGTVKGTINKKTGLKKSAVAKGVKITPGRNKFGRAATRGGFKPRR